MSSLGYAELLPVPRSAHLVWRRKKSAQRNGGRLVPPLLGLRPVASFRQCPLCAATALLLMRAGPGLPGSLSGRMPRIRFAVLPFCCFTTGFDAAPLMRVGPGLPGGISGRMPTLCVRRGCTVPFIDLAVIVARKSQKRAEPKASRAKTFKQIQDAGVAGRVGQKIPQDSLSVPFLRSLSFPFLRSNRYFLARCFMGFFIDKQSFLVQYVATVCGKFVDGAFFSKFLFGGSHALTTCVGATS